MRKTLVLFAFAFAAVALAGCGSSSSSGSGGGTVPDTASFAPATAAAFVSVNTDTTGDQWKKAGVLLDRFPSHDKLIQQIESSLAKQNVNYETDVKPALGPNVGLVAFDLAKSSPPYVFFTKSPEPDKLKALVTQGTTPAVTREEDGWTVVAQTTAALDRFDQERKSGSLADSSDFKNGISDVQADGLVLAYVPGGILKDAVGKAGVASATAEPFTSALGDVKSLAASASAEDQGVQFDFAGTVANASQAGTYDVKLDQTLPEKPIFFASVAHLDSPLSKLLDTVRQQDPSFTQQETQVEKALGVTLDGDVIPLFQNELAVGVYPQAAEGLPVTVDVVLVVNDEAKATTLMNRVGALLELGGSGSTTKVPVGNLTATKLVINGQNFAIYWAVTNGMLEISTSKAGLTDLQGGPGRLSTDSAYKDALQAASVPTDVSGLVYADLQTAVPFFVQIAGPGQTSAEAQANLKPLRSVVAYATQDGDTYQVRGFVGIG
jgi:hypothetical protein